MHLREEVIYLTANSAYELLFIIFNLEVMIKRIYTRTTSGHLFFRKKTLNKYFINAIIFFEIETKF